MMSGQGNRRRRYALVAAASIILILLLVLQAGPWQLADRLAGADLSIVALAVVFYLATIGLRALRWHLLLAASRHRVKGSIVLSQYAVGQAINDLTPVKVVGEGARIWGINRLAGVPLGTGLATVMAEKVMDLVLVTALLLVSVAVLFPDVPLRSWAPLASISAIVALANLAIIVLLRRPDIVRMVGRAGTRFAQGFRGGRYAERVEAKVENTIGTFDLARESSRTGNRYLAIAAALLTVPVWALEFARFALIMASLGVFAPLPMVVVAISLSQTLQVFVPGGGGNMAVVTDLFAGIGVAMATATAVGLLSVATSIWISLPIALVALVLTGRHALLEGVTDLPSGAADQSGDK
jgi:uncharacterized protein (TIRG00374 family)